MKLDNIINEISKISSMKAIASLSRFLQRPIGINTKSFEICYLETQQLLLYPDEYVVSTCIPIDGNVKGVSLLIYSEESALNICDILLNRSTGQTKSFHEMEISALSEIANICIGNFLTSFSEALQAQLITHKVAIFDNSSAVQLNQQIVSLFSNCFDGQILKFNLDFHVNHIKCMMLILFENHEVRSLLEKLISNACEKICCQ